MRLHRPVRFWVLLRRITDAEPLLMWKPSVNFFHTRFLEFLCSDRQTRNEGPEFEVTHVTQDDLSPWITRSNKIEEKGVELPWRSREIEECRIGETVDERPVKFWHSGDWCTVINDECVVEQFSTIKDIRYFDCIVNI
jgi:hypothetical protein